MKGINNSQVADSSQNEPALVLTRPSEPGDTNQKTKKRVSISIGEVGSAPSRPSKDLSKNHSSNIVYDFGTSNPENRPSPIIDRDIIENIEQNKKLKDLREESRRNSRASKSFNSSRKNSQISYLQTLQESLDNKKSSFSNDLEYGPSTKMAQNDSRCLGSICCWSSLREDPTNCKKRCVDYSLLISILCLFIVTLIGYIIILQLAESSDPEQDTSSSEFSGYVPMPNLNKTIEGAPYYDNSFGNPETDPDKKNATLLTTREFWMQCKYSDGADRFMFSCIQLDEHFVLKSKEEIKNYDEN